MAQKVKMGNFAEAIMDMLETYAAVSVEECEKIARQVAKEGAIKLKSVSPRGYGSKKGHYADGWTMKAVKTGNTDFSFIVHNAKKPGLTHLLENGHQLRNGGRANPYPHIAQVEKWCIEEYERRVEAML